MFDDQTKELAYKHSIHHRDELIASEKCGCFYCCSIFNVNEIIVWTDKKDTAICPHCEVDSVIGSASGFPITQEFLKEMQQHYFGHLVKNKLHPPEKI